MVVGRLRTWCRAMDMCYPHALLRFPLRVSCLFHRCIVDSRNECTHTGLFIYMDHAHVLDLASYCLASLSCFCAMIVVSACLYHVRFHRMWWAAVGIQVKSAGVDRSSRLLLALPVYPANMRITCRNLTPCCFSPCTMHDLHLCSIVAVTYRYWMAFYLFVANCE